MNKIIAFIKYFVPFSVVLLVVQYFVMQSLSDKLNFFYSVRSIYIFNISATFLVYLFLIFVNKIFPNYTGFAFIGIGFLKMLGVVIFLIPLIKANVKNPIIDLSTFFIPYFLFLIYETYFTVRLINKA